MTAVRSFIINEKKNEIKFPVMLENWNFSKFNDFLPQNQKLQNHRRYIFSIQV